jgi:glycosyltransferase involved in cell wall biosynthesis
MDVICFSHLRWNFVYQRPQHLMSRFTKHFRVFFIEEPIFDAEKGYLDNTLSSEGVWIIVPHLPQGLDEESNFELQRELLEDVFQYFEVKKYFFWYYTPMALPIGKAFKPIVKVYDCMDELSAFKNPPAGLQQRERELFDVADIVFTGGQSLYEAKKDLHDCIFPFPSSIDKKHFGKARTISAEPADQSVIPHPRIGFFGVIDERMDIQLLDEMATKKPDWHFVIIGPVVKIDPESLPKHENLHFLGSKPYKELPSYLAGWDIAMMPFAINESTRYISPTKTPEYLAGGKPVVSSPIHDVVSPYGENGLVYIAGDSDGFINGIEEELTMKDSEIWLRAVDSFLADNSWETTAEKMLYLVNTKIETKQHHSLKTNKEDEYV